MRKMNFLFIVFCSVIFLSSTKNTFAQAYEEVVEKIHYTHPAAMINGQQFDAKKEIGAPDPILKVYVWGDLGETYTKQFLDETFDQLVNKYRSEALFSFNHRTFSIPDYSLQAGILGECVARQGQFWANARLIADHADRLSSIDFLKNVNLADVESCRKTPSPKNIVNESESNGQYLGFNGTPTILIKNVQKNQQYSIKVSGAQSMAIFDRAFLEAKEGDLNKAGLEELKTQVNQLQTDTQQNKQDIQNVKTEQSRIWQEIDKLKQAIQTILEKIASLFGGSE